MYEKIFPLFDIYPLRISSRKIRKRQDRKNTHTHTHTHEKRYGIYQIGLGK